MESQFEINDQKSITKCKWNYIKNLQKKIIITNQTP